MTTQILQADDNALAEAARVLHAGGLVAFPTETVYGLGANALSAAAVARIFAAKGRPSRNPLIVHVTEAAAARALVADWPGNAAALALHFWPGPLTLVLKKTPVIPDIVTAGGTTVALRVPAHPVAQALLRTANIPLAAPSANRSNQLSPTLAEHVRRDLEGRIELILDGGPTSGGLESTVVDVTETPPRLLRPGLVTRADIEAVVGPIQVSEAAHTPTAEALRSPGLLGRHYAPRTPLHCRPAGQRDVEEMCAAGKRVAWLTFAAAPSAPAQATIVAMPASARDYAAKLYAVLHDLDQLGLDAIIVDAPPETDDWLAIRDRLKRAALIS